MAVMYHVLLIYFFIRCSHQKCLPLYNIDINCAGWKTDLFLWKGVFNKINTGIFGTASLEAFVSCTKKLN